MADPTIMAHDISQLKDGSDRTNTVESVALCSNGQFTPLFTTTFDAPPSNEEAKAKLMESSKQACAALKGDGGNEYPSVDYARVYSYTLANERHKTLHTAADGRCKLDTPDTPNSGGRKDIDVITPLMLKHKQSLLEALTDVVGRGFELSCVKAHEPPKPTPPIDEKNVRPKEKTL